MKNALNIYKKYQARKYEDVPDKELLIGILNAKECKFEHHKYNNYHQKTKRCIVFSFQIGTRLIEHVHFDVEWLNEDIQLNRPQLVDRLEKLMALK
jgi:hypothetical protein